LVPILLERKRKLNIGIYGRGLWWFTFLIENRQANKNLLCRRERSVTASLSTAFGSRSGTASAPASGQDNL
jgi:hypothetical protein